MMVDNLVLYTALQAVIPFVIVGLYLGLLLVVVISAIKVRKRSVHSYKARSKAKTHTKR